MDRRGEWTTEFYRAESGARPVAEFLRGLDQKTRTRFQWSLEQLRLRNVQARAPLVKHLDGPLWELREESNANIFRVIYCFFANRRIVLLHGFQKKTRKIPARELDTAMQRYRELVNREERR